jgi:hypothetical protein
MPVRLARVEGNTPTHRNVLTEKESLKEMLAKPSVHTRKTNIMTILVPIQEKS